MNKTYNNLSYLTSNPWIIYSPDNDVLSNKKEEENVWKLKKSDEILREV